MNKSTINPVVLENLQKQFPGMSKPIFSLTRNPDKYGVDLTQRARKIAGKKPKVEEHRNRPCRLYLRLTTREYRRLSERLNGRSKQEYLLELVRKELGYESDLQ